MADDDIDSLYNKIRNFLIQKGPSLMVDIASNIGKDTMQTGAILDYFVARGSLFKTNRKYGFSSIYFLQDQKDAALSKLYEVLNNNEKAIVNKFKTMKVIRHDDLSPAERYLIQNLSDFIKKLTAVDRETNQQNEVFAYYDVPIEDIKNILNGGANKETTDKKHEKITVKRNLNDNDTILTSMGFESGVKLEKNIFLAKYGNYKINVIVGVYPNKKPTKNDITKIAGYATKNRTVAFILTNSDLKHDYGNLINIVRINN